MLHLLPLSLYTCTSTPHVAEQNGEENQYSVSNYADISCFRIDLFVCHCFLLQIASLARLSLDLLWMVLIALGLTSP